MKKKIVILLAFLMIAIFVYCIQAQPVKEGYDLPQFIDDSKELARRMEKVKEFEKEYLSVLEAQHASVLADLKAGKYTDEITDTLGKVAREIADRY